jgi:ABC-type transport system involved in multi-copper enzyme maturation permease subunit
MLTFALPTYALVKRELLVQLRMGRTFFWLLVLAVITTFIILRAWPMGDIVNWREFSMFASVIMGIVTGSAYVGCALFVPGIAAVSVVAEKEQGNWDALYLTLISPKGIAFGKFLGSVTLYLIYLVALMPMLAVVFFLIGVDWSQFISLIVLIIATTCTLATIGVACSVSCRKTEQAVVASYIGMITVVAGLPLLVVWIAVEVFDVEWIELIPEEVGFALSGLASFFGLLSGGVAGTVFYWHLAYQALVAAAAVLWTIHVVRKPVQPPVAVQGRPTEGAADTPKNLLARIRSLVARSRRRTKPIVDSLNPMYAREMRHGLLFRHTHATTLGLVLISAFAGFNIDRESDFAWMWGLCCFGHGALICVFIPVFFSSLFTKESALGNLDMLLMTSLSPQEIARGKMYAAASRVGTLLLISLAANTVMFLLLAPRLKAGFVLAVMTGQITICVCAALVLVATMWASILSKRSGSAIITSFTLSFLSLFGALILIVIFSIISREPPPSNDWLIGLSPVSAYGVIMESLVRQPDDTPFAGWVASMAMHTLAVLGLYVGAILCYSSRVSTTIRRGSGN